MIGDHLRRQLRDDPYQSIAWDPQVGTNLWAPDAPGELYTDVTQPLPPETRKRLDHRNVCYPLVDQRMVVRGVTADTADRERLAQAVSMEMQRLVQDHQGYLLGKTESRTTGALLLNNAPRANNTPLTFDAVIDGWLAEKNPIKKTEYVWRRTLKQISDFLDHDDVRSGSADNLVAWKADACEGIEG